METAEIFSCSTNASLWWFNNQVVTFSDEGLYMSHVEQGMHMRVQERAHSPCVDKIKGQLLGNLFKWKQKEMTDVISDTREAACLLTDKFPAACQFQFCLNSQ